MKGEDMTQCQERSTEHTWSFTLKVPGVQSVLLPVGALAPSSSLVLVQGQKKP